MVCGKAHNTYLGVQPVKLHTINRPRVIIQLGNFFIPLRDPFAAGANGLMTGNYLTVAGSQYETDLAMIENLGLQVAPGHV